MHSPQKARGNVPPQKTFGLAADFSENRRFGRKGTRGPHDPCRFHAALLDRTEIASKLNSRSWPGRSPRKFGSAVTGHVISWPG